MAFDKNYLRKEDLIKQKEYHDIKIAKYDTGYIVKPDMQQSIAISVKFGELLAPLLRDTNRLFTWKEAEEIIDVVCSDETKIENDLYKIARKRKERTVRKIS